MQSIGIPYGLGPFAGVAELFGELAILLGLFTSVVAALFVLWMISLIWLNVYKIKKKFMGGYELDVVLLILALALVALGGGVFSLDHLLSAI